MSSLDSIVDHAANDRHHGATEIDELLGAGPELVEEGTGRCRPLFEASAMDLVTERIRE